MNKFLHAGIIASATVILDQLTKYTIQSSLPLWSSKTIIPNFFNLVHAVNKGAAFGFLNRADITWQRGFFIVITLIALGVIYYLIKSMNKIYKVQVTALSLLLGGAVGNLIDRILFGQVTDFLDFYIGNYHWPAFNVADIALTVGAFMMIIAVYINKNDGSDNITN
ncbi:signal peptidase II [Maridesulfovibrio bastinii]|uniref:signal peptidase II n=1 Tax=Maridesulfovibrio bastinii TaxID=47157 RepID=UPI00040EDAD8|nr:signal peptidase II [Maridesulfovibrio bastinii]